MVFHIVVGTMLASKGGRTFVLSRLPAASVSAALAAAALSLAVLLLGPAIAKHSAIIEAAEACSTGQLAAGQAALARAVAADPLDAGPAADQAALLLRAAQQEMSQPRAELLLQRAIEAMTLAVERQPMHAGYRHELLELRVFQRECSLLWGRWYNPPPDLPAARKEVASLLREQPDNPGLLNIAAQYAYQASDFDAAAAYMDRASRITSWPILLDHLGDIRWAAGDAQAAAALWRTFQQDRRGRFELTDPAFAQAAGQIVDLDRQNARQQLDLAQLAWQAGQLDQVAPLLDATQAADAALPPLVVMRLTAAEKAQIALLRQKLTAAGG
jgi:tetratricopeptide (TPR) repeat protein